MKSSNSVHYGVGILDLLLVLFIGLKLIGKITWSWVWVLSPFWIQFVIVAVLVIVMLIASKVTKRSNQ